MSEALFNDHLASPTPKKNEDVSTPLIFPDVSQSLKMIEEGRAADVVATLPGKFSLDLDINTERSALLRLLVKNDLAKEVLQKLSPIDIYKLLPESIDFLKKTIKDGYGKQVLELLPQPFPLLRELTPPSSLLGSGALLVRLVANGLGKELLSKVEPYSQFDQMSYGASTFLIECIKQGLDAEVANLLPPDITLGAVSSETMDLLGYILSSPSSEKLAYLLAENPRAPITLNDVDTSNIDAATLEKSFDYLRVHSKYLGTQNGWDVYEFEKKTGPPMKIYMNAAQMKVVFRSTEISEESLTAYARARKAIPQYVSSPFYLELVSDEQIAEANTFAGSGLREVFAGVSLDQIDLTQLPVAVQKSIRNQQNFILLKLSQIGVEHGHASDSNFNVRFLLVDKEGNKTLLFDPKYAIERAQNEGQTITPIVTLRDWDQAISSIDA